MSRIESVESVYKNHSRIAAGYWKATIGVWRLGHIPNNHVMLIRKANDVFELNMAHGDNRVVEGNIALHKEAE